LSEHKLKPWQIDDPLGEDLIDDPAQIAASSIPDVAPAKPAAPLVLPTWLPGVAVSDSLALVPILAAALIVLLLNKAPFVTDEGVTLWARALLGGLLVSGVLVLGWNAMARRRSVQRVVSSLDGLSQGRLEAGAEAHLPNDMRPLWQAIEKHVTKVESGVRDLADMQRKMQLDLTLAETHRRRTLAVVRAMSEPVLVTDPFDQIVLANPAFEELFQLREADVLRKPLEEAIDDAEVVRAIRESRAADARTADRRKVLTVGERVFSLAMSPLGSTTSQLREETHSVVTIFRDITREHEASRQKSEFVAHVAHELRTPLSSIRAYVEMLVDGEVTDQDARNEYYDIIQTSAERLGRLIDNMLNISRIEAGTVRINREPIGVSLIVREAVDTMRPSADAKRIELKESLTPAMYQVDADRDLIFQAVLNLISNAIKYTPEEGTVTVRMTPQEERRRILVEIEDTGAGIPAEDVPRMFEKFFRVEANKKMAKGTGLGLNLVKKIVEDVHGGEVFLKTEEGRGSTFSIALPLAGQS